MDSKTVRIKTDTHAKLKELAGELRQPMPDVLATAIYALYRLRFLESCNRAYAKLKANPGAWREELAEGKAWDSIPADEHGNRPAVAFAVRRLHGALSAIVKRLGFLSKKSSPGWRAAGNGFAD